MRILIIDQCSGSKSHPESSPVYSADEIDEYGLEGLLNREESTGIPARELYAGRQQKYISEAVDTLREAGQDVTRYFISAGFGVVGEREQLPPYEVTFSEMSAGEVRERSEQLEITSEIAEIVSGEKAYDIVFFALGSDYYQALDLDGILEGLPEETTAVLFNQEERSDKFENTISISARLDEAKEQGTIVVAVKGVFLQNFAEHLVEGNSVTSVEDVRTYCSTDPAQTGLDQFG